MSSETPTIRYNLKDRGRQHTGQARSFNIRAVCDAINGPACQERVATRGMPGYYGHLPRIRFGMRPAEGGVDGGKYVPVEPAFVTTHLKADYDGNVEHRAEFLDTTSGLLAKKLFDSKMGGFSSAIDAGRPEFFGMDFVLEPNYLGNSHRGIVLDDASSMTYDDVAAAEQDENARGMIFLLDSIEAERTLSSAVIDRLTEENEQLLSMLARTGVSAGAVLDSAAVRPLLVSVEAVDRMRRDKAAFDGCVLPGFVAPPDKREPEKSLLHERLLTRFLG